MFYQNQCQPWYIIFEQSFIILAKADETALDRRGVGNMGFIRFFDLLEEPTIKKCNRAVGNDANLDQKWDN